MHCSAWLTVATIPRPSFEDGTPLPDEPPDEEWAPPVALDDYRRARLSNSAQVVVDVRHDLDVDDELDEQFETGIELPTLPAEFWEQRRFLAHLRDYAWSKYAYPEGLLGAVLARAAALTRRGTVVNSGIGEPVTMTLYVGMLANSGRGKSTSLKLARHYLPYIGDRWVLDPGQHQDDPEPFIERSLGSGEGIVEAFMGSAVAIERVGPKGGRPPVVRRQVRYNAFLTVDEGESLIAGKERRGSTLGPLLREAWNSNQLGQQNGSEVTSRHVIDHQLGLVVGFHLRHAMLLFAEADIGTPQRFLWMPVRSPRPRDRPAVPPLLYWEPPSATSVLEVADEIHEELVQELIDDPIVPIMDSQRPAMLLKLAGLFAILDQRTEVSVEDWCIARQLYAFSSAAIAAVGEHGRELETRRRVRETSRRASAAAVTRVRVDNAAADLRRVAAVIARAVERKGDDGMTPGAAKKATKSGGADREMAGDALNYALRAGWIKGDQILQVGPRFPELQEG